MSSILRLSEAFTLGLHALKMMGEREGELLSVMSISEEFEVSYNHLSKVLQKLVKANLVKSVKGFGGGFSLTRAPEDIRVIDVYEAIEGKFKPDTCLLNRDNCPHKYKCEMKNFLNTLNLEVEKFFKDKNLTNI